MNIPTIIYLVSSKIRFHRATFNRRQATNKAKNLTEFHEELGDKELYVVERIPYLQPNETEELVIDEGGNLIKRLVRPDITATNNEQPY